MDGMDASLMLVEPCAARLPRYGDACRRGWSPDTDRDISAERYADYRRLGAGLLDGLVSVDRVVEAARRVRPGNPGASIPARTPLPRWLFPPRPDPIEVRWLRFWIWDGDFAGARGLRFAPLRRGYTFGDLGHAGFSVVPWRRGRGYAGTALDHLVRAAGDAGLAAVSLFAHETNPGARRVIESRGGVARGRSNPRATGPDKIEYWITC